MSADSCSIFTRIIAGQIPCQRVYENEHVLAFLDINPLSEGHTLVVPKREVARYEDLAPDEAAELGRAVAHVTKLVLAATQTDGCNVLLNNGVVAHQEVPHVHFHIIPRRENDGLGYRWKPQKGDPARLEALAKKMRAEA